MFESPYVLIRKAALEIRMRVEAGKHDKAFNKAKEKNTHFFSKVIPKATVLSHHPKSPCYPQEVNKFI